MTTIKLKNLIYTISSYDDGYDLYMNKDTSFDKNDLCILLHSDNTLEKKDLIYIFGIYALKDIIDNLCQQKPDFTVEDAIESIKFYYTHDAFIEISEQN